MLDSRRCHGLRKKAKLATLSGGEVVVWIGERDGILSTVLITGTLANRE